MNLLVNKQFYHQLKILNAIFSSNNPLKMESSEMCKANFWWILSDIQSYSPSINDH